MKLFIGLGNPGNRYEANRHNIGFMAVDEIVRRHNFSPWKSKFQGLVSEGTLDGEKVLCLKPETFMNLSGQSVTEAMKFYKLTPDDIVVLHDELDLVPAKLKIKMGGGHAGHNGLRNIIQHIGADYKRVRLGIGHPGHKDAVHGYVLSDFHKTEAQWVDDEMDAIAREAHHLAHGDDVKFMTEVARHMQAAGHKG